MTKIVLVNDKSSPENQGIQSSKQWGGREALLDQTIKEGFPDLWSEKRMKISHATSMKNIPGREKSKTRTTPERAIRMLENRSHFLKNIIIIIIIIIIILYRKYIIALAGVAQWIEPNQRVAGWIPSQDTCLGCRPGPSMGHVRGNHTLMFLSLSFSLPPPLSKNKWVKS